MSELLHNVESIFKDDGFLSQNNKVFYYIPLYQRGYKWTYKQVEKLLNDIDNFSAESGKFYCVQNITLVPKDEHQCFNVVDGQQRLTTMVILLSALGEKELVKHKVRFPENSIRKMTNIFINEYITDTEEDLLENFPTWEILVDRHPDLDHQDIFYLYQSYKTIKDWLSSKDEDGISMFTQKLLNHVKFISNNIEGQEEEKIFGNLNSKRIYLDGADLVRAILITRVTAEESKREADIKNIVRVNERRVRIGWELDEINYWWSQPEIQNYYKPWIRLDTIGDIQFNRKKNPINNLIFLFAESEGYDSLSLEIIEEYQNTLGLYQKLNKVFDTLKDWYNDKEIYHYLGFLFAQKRDKKDFNFSTVWNFWNSNACRLRSDFKTYLIGLIKSEVFNGRNLDELFKQEKNWYEGDPKTLVQILLLIDIHDANKEYKDRLKTHAFFKSGNDIEHIFPQNPPKVEDKKEFINFLLGYDDKLSKEEILISFDDKKNEEEYLEQLDEFLENYTKTIPIHSIGNLVLLYDSLNRSIGNKPYAYKRKRVLKHFNDGNYIQPHTLRVFARYFQDVEIQGDDVEYWNQSDIEANEKCIKQDLFNFFKIKA